MEVTALSIAWQFRGIKEIAGDQDHPFIQWCHSISGGGIDDPDEIPWCSSLMNGIAFILDLSRSRSRRARSWLQVGERIRLIDAKPGFDVVILKRGRGEQPGPEVIAAPGHVGLFVGFLANGDVLVWGGNQSNAANIKQFPADRILGIRRLH